MKMAGLILFFVFVFAGVRLARAVGRDADFIRSGEAGGIRNYEASGSFGTIKDIDGTTTERYTAFLCPINIQCASGKVVSALGDIGVQLTTTDRKGNAWWFVVASVVYVTVVWLWNTIDGITSHWVYSLGNFYWNFVVFWSTSGCE